ncbi:polyunsaturated fatty acid 5-lipoxygenase isoform X4 [Pituophis catenifer annectens]|uniref:polyunsaturated fatty acid 5-lipoxygenase isoform X4 n=1 Tax=Pituophis catenifer annectens TaxID=94852 RepID=UPI00399612DC
MPSYLVTVATGNQWFAGTDDYIYLTLVGLAGTSERHLLDKPFYNDFERGATDTYEVTVTEDLGEIQLIKIEKRKYWFPDDWYLKYITVKTPVGDYLEFPCYRWITDEKEVVFRDGQAKLFDDEKTQILKQSRRKELEERQKLYRWAEWHPGFPLNIDAKSHKELPRNIQFDSEKGVDFILNYTKAMENLYINRFMHMFQSSWSDFADFEKIFVKISNTISEYVMQHWQEDFMFGYQFLNGCNPVLIKKCIELPKKFPVTTEMVEYSLERNLTLEQEIKLGNIFIVDYELLDDVEVNKTDPCTAQYLAAPICLLYKNLENKILPIAIQINQAPQQSNPIFLPSDAKYDWLLAKIWVRSSDFHIHQTVTHLLRTHLISEVFAVAMFRQLPAVHPLFKLLIPHVRFTIAINTKAREQLICEYGLFDKANATGGGGHVQMVQRAMKHLTYSSLCFPEEIKSRHMESNEDIPYYYYRDDGVKVWDAIKSFVTDIINIYYGSEEAVCEDLELKAFVKDIFVYGMRSNKDSGFPKAIKTREKLSEYLTIVIFTSSAQHAAVNFGQVFLGIYPDEHFTEKPVKEAMRKFRKNLDRIASYIAERNRNKKLPYYYLSPDQIPNSVAV